MGQAQKMIRAVKPRVLSELQDLDFVRLLYVAFTFNGESFIIICLL